jgi:hypothetical protein
VHRFPSVKRQHISFSAILEKDAKYRMPTCLSAHAEPALAMAMKAASALHLAIRSDINI